MEARKQSVRAAPTTAPATQQYPKPPPLPALHASVEAGMACGVTAPASAALPILTVLAQLGMSAPPVPSGPPAPRVQAALSSVGRLRSCVLLDRLRPRMQCRRRSVGVIEATDLVSCGHQHLFGPRGGVFAYTVSGQLLQQKDLRREAFELCLGGVRVPRR